MHEDRFRVHVSSMTCAGCGNKLAANERGKECPGCKYWPLCDKCASEHNHAMKVEDMLCSPSK